MLKGKKRKDTVCIVLADENCDEGKIRMNKVVRKNLRVRLGDVVSVHQVRESERGSRTEKGKARSRGVQRRSERVETRDLVFASAWTDESTRARAIGII